MTLKVKSEKVLSLAINILFKIYETNFLPNLIEKISKLILGKDPNPQSPCFSKMYRIIKINYYRIRKECLPQTKKSFIFTKKLFN